MVSIDVFLAKIKTFIEYLESVSVSDAEKFSDSEKFTLREMLHFWGDEKVRLLEYRDVQNPPEAPRFYEPALHEPWLEEKFEWDYGWVQFKLVNGREKTRENDLHFADKKFASRAANEQTLPPSKPPASIPEQHANAAASELPAKDQASPVPSSASTPQREREPITETLERAVERILKNPVVFQLMTYEEAALAIRKSPSTVRRWCDEGKLKRSKGRVLTASVIAFLNPE